MRKSSSQRRALFDQMMSSPARTVRPFPSKSLSKGSKFSKKSMNFLRFGSPTQIIIHIPSKLDSERISPIKRSSQLEEFPQFSKLNMRREKFKIERHPPSTLAFEPTGQDLLDKFSEVKVRSVLFKQYYGKDALEFLGLVKQEEVSKIYASLTETPAIVNSTDITGNSALHYAVMAQNLELVKLLLIFKANFLHKNMNGLTPLSIAEANESLDIASLIKKSIT